MPLDWAWERASMYSCMHTCSSVASLEVSELCRCHAVCYCTRVNPQMPPNSRVMCGLAALVAVGGTRWTLSVNERFHYSVRSGTRLARGHFVCGSLSPRLWFCFQLLELSLRAFGMNAFAKRILVGMYHSCHCCWHCVTALSHPSLPAPSHLTCAQAST